MRVVVRVAAVALIVAYWAAVYINRTPWWWEW